MGQYGREGREPRPLRHVPDGRSGNAGAISDGMSANICPGIATPAIWNVTQRPWLTALAPILTN